MKPTRKTDALGWLRRQCRALVGVEEKVAWGHPVFHANGRTIAAFEVVHGRPSIAVLAERDRQEILVEHFCFFRTPYSGRYGWVSAWVDVPAPWDLIGSLLAEAHASAVAGPPRRVSPPKAKGSASPTSSGTRSRGRPKSPRGA
jgi:predicted DNA-binding protein (MmcQ/YjbR family)